MSAGSLSGGAHHSGSRGWRDRKARRWQSPRARAAPSRCATHLQAARTWQPPLPTGRGMRPHASPTRSYRKRCAGFWACGHSPPGIGNIQPSSAENPPHAPSLTNPSRGPGRPAPGPDRRDIGVRQEGGPDRTGSAAAAHLAHGLLGDPAQGRLQPAARLARHVAHALGRRDHAHRARPGTRCSTATRPTPR